MRSVAICTALWNPMLTSVPSMSLSMVFGTPTTGTSGILAHAPIVPSPPMTMKPSSPCTAIA